MALQQIAEFGRKGRTPSPSACVCHAEPREQALPRDPLCLIWGTLPGVRRHPLPPKWDWKTSQLEMFRAPQFFNPPLDPSESQHSRKQVPGWRPGVWADLLLPQPGDYRSCARLRKARKEVSGRHESKGRVQRA